MAQYGLDRFPPTTYQQHVGKNARVLLQKNSQELLEVLTDNNIIQSDMKIFELGSGPGRNLKYIHDYNNTVQLYANDLSEEYSLLHMHDSIKNKIHFIEKDSVKLLYENIMTDIDLFISSDHLMHLTKTDGSLVLAQLVNKWKPIYILLREIKEEFEDINHPRNWQDYNILISSYELIFEKNSNQTDRYFIRLYKLKGDIK